ncbi:aromatic ring-hydroxylating dioxygenase subunit alpha [Telmatocola sphagniphila]|uniref:Aromatic ring-hydroxylating dioxygenase subunit alpha n=1 Tax=Telmatocola sphagniphila TaxID=1123043 RepID=A0A8E6B8R3_9BACT|nr:aromatic ring-hydroxylating dioxygenase subunit alpha [Telmatocola sphagniphila]QVL33452.1 aromatic ring-hydroxylating dioxygenase subunit alpha [Telmatocola sphagniphila]
MTEIESILHAFDDRKPLSQASTIPSECYFSNVVAERESRILFPQTWQYVCSIQQLEQSGSYVRSWIGPEPIFAIRGEDQQIRVFLNICRHRAAPIIDEDCGRCSKLRCRYHGWTYDLQGKLRGVPEFDGVENFTREDNGLVEIHSAIWGDFLFARIEQSGPALDEFFAPLSDEFQQKLRTLQFFKRVVFPVKSNWKIYIDNYLDGGYHVNTVHPTLAGSLDYKLYRTELHPWASLQSSPLTQNPEDAAANRTRQGSSASYWWFYPNFMLNHYEGVMDLNYVIPRTTESCDVIFDFYFAAGSYPASISFKEESIRVAQKVQEEDDLICAEVQKNIRSHFYSQGRFSVKRENGGYHFHQLYARHLRGQSLDAIWKGNS